VNSTNAPRRDPHRWPQIEKICAAAVDMDDSSRAAFLENACAGDATLRGAVESLLAQVTAADGFLEEQALTHAARQSVSHMTGALLGHRLGPY
jgi:hypothetical protein